MGSVGGCNGSIERGKGSVGGCNGSIERGRGSVGGCNGSIERGRGSVGRCERRERVRGMGGAFYRAKCMSLPFQR